MDSNFVRDTVTSEWTAALIDRQLFSHRNTVYEEARILLSPLIAAITADPHKSSLFRVNAVSYLVLSKTYDLIYFQNLTFSIHLSYADHSDT